MTPLKPTSPAVNVPLWSTSLYTEPEILAEAVTRFVAVPEAAGTGLPLPSTAKSTVAELRAGLPAPTTSIVMSFVMLALIASGVGLAKFVQIKLPEPEPSGAMVAEMNCK